MILYNIFISLLCYAVLGEVSPAQVMTSILKNRSSVTNRWYGLMGNDHAPSLGEWQRILLQSSAFIYYGYERCLADFSSNYLAPLNLAGKHSFRSLNLVGNSSLEAGTSTYILLTHNTGYGSLFLDCRSVILLDQMHSYQSFHGQAKTDAQKRL